MPLRAATLKRRGPRIAIRTEGEVARQEEEPRAATPRPKAPRPARSPGFGSTENRARRWPSCRLEKPGPARSASQVRSETADGERPAWRRPVGPASPRTHCTDHCLAFSRRRGSRDRMASARRRVRFRGPTCCGSPSTSGRVRDVQLSGPLVPGSASTASSCSTSGGSLHARWSCCTARSVIAEEKQLDVTNQSMRCTGGVSCADSPGIPRRSRIPARQCLERAAGRMAAVLGEVLTAIVTPFDKDGAVDYERFRALARHVIDSGADGLVVAATTGESPTLTDDEKFELWTRERRRGGGEGDRDRQHGHVLDRPLRAPDRAGARARRRRLPRRHAVLQQAAAARDRRALQGDRRGQRQADHRLQHPAARGREHRAGDDASSSRRSRASRPSSRRPRISTRRAASSTRPTSRSTRAATTSSTRSSRSAASAASSSTATSSRAA